VIKEMNERWITAMMWLSMMLLSTFLGIYLYKAYKTEQENLRKEVGYLFVNAVNNIEGGLINDLIFKKDNFTKKINLTSKLRSDSIRVMVIGTHDNKEELLQNPPFHSGPLPPLKTYPREDNVFIQRQISDDQRSLQHTEGMISLIFRTETDSMGPDSIHHHWTVLTKLTDSLKERFDVNLKKAGIPVTYTLSQYKDTTRNTMSESPNLAGTYHDLASGEKYDVHLTSSHWYIFKKLWPEIVLAILVLTCLGLAFYSMFITIRREKNLLDAKSDFIQNMTHELKTPISTVRVALEALYEFDGINDIKKRDDYLRISQNELDRLSLLVDRVLSMSKIDKALPAAQKEIINMTELVSHITDTLKVQAEKQNTRIIIHQSDPTISIYADPQWVSGIVYNLLDNAIKYSNKDEPSIEIFIHKKNEQIELKVQDNGPGIGRDHQTKIFEKFYRIPQGNIHTVKGHGLGLAFVWRIVKEMGGKISIDSELGKGSVFNVTLPA
jgi:two-component system, OmpR family, phosphate regulon sensor histidine kinase PhoR